MVRVLVVNDLVPYPLVSGDRLRVYHLLRRLAVEHEVWLAALIDTAEEVRSLPRLAEFCQGIEAAEMKRMSPFAHLPGLARHAISGIPLEFKFYYSRELANKIRTLAATVDFDIVEIQHSHMARYLEALPPGSRAKRLLVFHNIAFDQYGRLARIEQNPSRKLRLWIHARMARRWEPRYAERFDRCITVSQADRDLLAAANSRLCADIIPNGVDARGCQPLPKPTGARALLFVGKMSYAPCYDAAKHFCDEILPLVRSITGDVQFWIVGADPPPEVRVLGSESVFVTGRVEDVAPYYGKCSVCVVPLRAGGGTRLKILEAMALGRPVVSTSIGCEGLDVVDGEHLLIADDPRQFAEKTARLLTDDSLYQRIVAAARQLVLDRYDWGVISRRLLQLYADVMDVRAQRCA